MASNWFSAVRAKGEGEGEGEAPVVMAGDFRRGRWWPGSARFLERVMSAELQGEALLVDWLEAWAFARIMACGMVSIGVAAGPLVVGDRVRRVALSLVDAVVSRMEAVGVSGRMEVTVVARSDGGALVIQVVSSAIDLLKPMTVDDLASTVAAAGVAIRASDEGDGAVVSIRFPHLTECYVPTSAGVTPMARGADQGRDHTARVFA